MILLKKSENCERKIKICTLFKNYEKSEGPDEGGKKPRNSARRTSQETGQRVLRAQRARTRPMWPNGQTDRDAGQIGRGDRRATCGMVQYSCSPSCAPSSTSSADFGTRFLSASR